MRKRPHTSPNIFVTAPGTVRRPLRAHVKWGDLRITDRWPYGCWETEWTVILKPYQRIPSLVTGALVEVCMGSGCRWVGTLGKPDWDTGRMTAYGLVRHGEGMLCLNNFTGETTSTPDFAIDHAIARGLPWVRRISLSNVPFGNTETTVDLNYLTALIDAFCTTQIQKWGVNARRELYLSSDAGKLGGNNVGIMIRPGAGEFGVSDANQAARIFGRYKNASSVYSNVDVGSGIPEVGVSLEEYGIIDSTKATAVITGIRDAVQPKASFSNGVTVTADMVTTLGGQRMGLEQVVANGQSARMVGLRDDRGVLAYTDVVLSESVWDVSAGQVTVTPAGMDDQTLAGAVEAVGGILL